MSLSLHAAIVPSQLQIVRAARGVIDKAAAFCAGGGADAEDLVQARLADDMLPLGYQVRSIRTHSLGAIEAVRKGVFAPVQTPPPASFAEFTALLDETAAGLEALDPAEIDGWVGNDMRFEFREFRVEYTAENFLLSFSQPNFYFHATTTYDILRWKGVPIGKRDYMGQPRSKG